EGDDPAPLDRDHDERAGAHSRSARAEAGARHHHRPAAGDRRDEVPDRRHREERRAHGGAHAPARGARADRCGGGRMIRSALLLALVPLLALGGCNRNTAPGNDREAQLDPAPNPAPRMDASAALSGIATEVVQAETMSDADLAS